jgi:hypothetical protein
MATLTRPINSKVVLLKTRIFIDSNNNYFTKMVENIHLTTTASNGRRIRRTINRDNHHLHNKYVLLVFVLSTFTLCHSLYTCDTCFAQCSPESLHVGARIGAIYKSFTSFRIHPCATVHRMACRTARLARVRASIVMRKW